MRNVVLGDFLLFGCPVLAVLVLDTGACWMHGGPCLYEPTPGMFGR